ncbi:MAG: protein phosphatase 2C domain-containing protein [Aureispira sp.]
MKIDQHLALGAFHPVFCEDFCVCYDLGDNWTVLAVLDGCSAGTDSHFAATLLGKIIHKISREVPYWGLQNSTFYLSKVEITVLGKALMKALFEAFCQIKQQLFLEINELVSTCLLALYHNQRKQAWVNSSGDGVLVINEDHYVLDQADKPNYMAYHHLLSAEEWLAKQTYSALFEEVHNLALSTDGILSFEGAGTLDPLSYLLKENSRDQSLTLLQKKCRILERDYQLCPNDDLGIVRLWNP